ncbi:MAG TPA: holdfast anchoring protein HfaA [Caulobacter sp.]|uniref:holdfast anchoring protein HfaA n=1 Tax=uncultured Brevundimonas sp. TaxID=213418 RepID=UPI00261A2318|nr:holdfast anchoring protein HfaA [uncultured Brevundimonas sp.]HRD45957.1 holdfast anchoring protein HfaA [Caulobacter sp.]
MVATLLKTAPLALAAVVAVGPVASAQTMTSNSASMNAGYGRVAGEENRLNDFGGRDANGNRLIVDGVIQSGEDQSSFSRTGGGVWSSGSGVGYLGGSSTAIGNNLVVVTQGSWNTVIVNSSQTNNGNVTAGSSTSGGVGGQ